MVVDETQKQRIYQVKSESINLINQMSKSKTLCFNKLIRDELDTEKRGRQSLSKLILEWVFSERQRHVINGRLLLRRMLSEEKF